MSGDEFDKRLLYELERARELLEDSIKVFRADGSEDNFKQYERLITLRAWAQKLLEMIKNDKNKE